MFRNMASIREKLEALSLPDLCNLGVWLRILLAVNGMAFIFAMQGLRKAAAVAEAVVEVAAYVEPTTLGSLMLACAIRRWLVRLPPWLHAGALLVLALACASLVAGFMAALDDQHPPLWLVWLWTAAVVIVLLVWFDLVARAFAPALAEARLLALTARIRPHFLFNSLNAVLGVIRSDPRRAETALEELADLFRNLMQDNRNLVPLSAELALTRQYLDLERLRLGDRLQVRWDVDSCPPDALVPPLMLQPLLENAVYHGVEPLDRPGEIEVRLSRLQDQLLISVANPCPEAEGTHHHSGNRMALENIRERLALFFDLEASLSTGLQNGRYEVRIELPYRRETAT